MFDSLIGLVVLIGVAVWVMRQHNRLGMLERELGALRSLVLSMPQMPSADAAARVGEGVAPEPGFTGAAPDPRSDRQQAEEPAGTPAAAPASGQAGPMPDTLQGAGRHAEALDSEAPEDVLGAAPSAGVDPWRSEQQGTLAASAARIAAGGTGAAEPAGQGRPADRRAARATEPAHAAAGLPAAALPAAGRDIETALGTRWAVWVGGVALALGGVLLVRYSIEAGIFGPRVRLFLATLFGLVLLGGGEFLRRSGYRAPAAGAANAYIPAILTGAGAFTLFGAIYAAHGVYGFIGPGPAFLMMGMLGIAAIALALLHGQALAGLGLLAAMATPLLVNSQAPNAWALFGYIAVALAAAAVIARLRDWALLMAAAFAGTGLWTALYIAEAPEGGIDVLLFISAVTLAVLALVWLARREPAPAPETRPLIDHVSVVPAFFLALTALGLFVNPRFAGTSGAYSGAALIVAMLGVAHFRQRALPLLHAAGGVTVLIYLQSLLTGSLSLGYLGTELDIGALPLARSATPALAPGLVLGLVLLGAGLWKAHALAAISPLRTVRWAGWGAAVPLAIIAALWLALGNPDRDLVYAAAAIGLAVALAAGAEWVARAEAPPLSGGYAVSVTLVGAGLALVLAIHAGFGSLVTTILVGAAAALPAWTTRSRSWPVLGWLSLGAALVTAARVAIDPGLVGADLSTTPLFNQLLPGYGIPALAFAYAAWQLRRTQDGRPRLAMEAAAALFALLTAAMLVRHAMNSGVIDAGAPSLAEQAIYTLLALGAGAILISLEQRAPSPVLRLASLIVGVASVVFSIAQHFLLLNPLFTDESTGQIPVFNLLLPAYLLPGGAAAALAWYAQHRRPRWYSAMLAAFSAALLFAYATLSVRRLFHGEFVAWWRGLGQIETYSYSALWLLLGAALLAAGVRFQSQVLRIASAALISVAVAKVFLFDMSELEGVLRALSFIGLGAVLIGIGLFYQRLLTRAAAR